jgi:hypothetical protein
MEWAQVVDNAIAYLAIIAICYILFVKALQ